MRARVAAVVLIALAGCDAPRTEAPAKTPVATAETPTPTETTAFAHDFDDDRSGYYIPVEDVRVGAWVLDHMFVGQRFEFDAWEGGDRSATFAPVMIEFEDTESPMVRAARAATASCPRPMP